MILRTYQQMRINSQTVLLPMTRYEAMKSQFASYYEVRIANSSPGWGEIL